VKVWYLRGKRCLNGLSGGKRQGIAGIVLRKLWRRRKKFRRRLRQTVVKRRIAEMRTMVTASESVIVIEVES
jgi:hypothetical protein